MVHILAKRNLHKLAEFASSNVLLAFDYDGTLAPIVSEPKSARMRAATRRLLTEVARRYPCVVISGRARDDVIRHVGNVPVWHVSGNHGLEPWGQDARYRIQVDRWVRRLKQQLSGHEGVAVEDKQYSVTVHFRNASQRRRAVSAVDRAVRGLKGARALAGKRAISLLPKGAADKGTALRRTQRLLACDTAIYLGDDETDEDAFGADGPDRLLSIRVSRRGRSRAGFYVRDQAEVDQLLRALLNFRPLRHVKRHVDAMGRRSDAV
jgi:trehalose 6-phosphate phosphatase